MTKSVYFVAAIAVAVVVALVVLWPRGSSPLGGAAPGVANQAPAVGGAAPVKVSPAGPGKDAAPPPTATAALPASETAASQSPVATGGNAAFVGITTIAPAATVAPGTQEAMIDLDKTKRMIRDYRTLMGENPVGTNAEIMKAIMGGNPRQATLGPAEGQQLNAKGELVDQWGTPYFFHQLSGDHMEIHSAGPDRIMGTDDDLILK